MENDDQTGIAEWMLQDLREQADRLNDGKFLADLADIGNTLCDIDAARVKSLMFDVNTSARIEAELDLVLPHYLVLLKDSIDRSGEETYLSIDEVAKLLASHGKTAPCAQPKLPLESGCKGYALMQAAAALAGVDETLIGPWYLTLKFLLGQPARATD